MNWLFQLLNYLFDFSDEFIHLLLVVVVIDYIMVNTLYIRLPHQREIRTLFHFCGPHGSTSILWLLLMVENAILG